MQIQDFIKKMPHITLQHTKGHQDRTKPYHELSLLAQLNVDADSKAIQFQAQHGAPRPHIEPNARTQAFFFTSEGTIIARYTSKIYTATSAPPLRQYLQQRNNWTASTMTSINWEAHKKAIKTTSLPKVHVVKLVHNIIPTNKQVYQQDSDSAYRSRGRFEGASDGPCESEQTSSGPVAPKSSLALQASRGVAIAMCAHFRIQESRYRQSKYELT
jgi:hypothetical protein